MEQHYRESKSKEKVKKNINNNKENLKRLREAAKQTKNNKKGK